MTKQVNQFTAATSGPLSFTKGTGATGDDVKRFYDGVNRDAKKVCDGIVAVLMKQGKTATAKAVGGKWIIMVGSVNENHMIDAHAEENTNVTANITVTANTADIPNVITALNTFFSNWRAVVGLIATGAALASGVWLMSVNRQG